MIKRSHKYVLILLNLFFTTFAQTDSLTQILKRVELSTNYAANVKILESALLNYGDTSRRTLNLQSNLINNYNSLQQFDKASSLCQIGILRAQKNRQPYHEAALYLGLAKTYYNLNQKDKMAHYVQECLAIAEPHKYYDLLKKAYNNLGALAIENVNNYNAAENYFLKAIEYGKKIKPTAKDNLARNYRLLATTYDCQGRFNLADSAFNLAAGIYQKFNDSLGFIEVLTFRARLFKSLKKYSKALELSKEAIALSQKLKNDEYLQTALSMYEQILVELQNYREAYVTSKEIFELETIKNQNTLKKELAESETKFKVAELQNKQEVLELQNKQTKQKYTFAFITLLIVAIAIVVIVYQRKIARQQQDLKLKTQAEVHMAEEKERSRIAKDLHDNMGAYATSILAQIDNVELSSGETKNEKIKELRVDAENIMATLRETIWILKTKSISATQFFDLVKIYADKNLIKNLNIKVVYNEQITGVKYLSPAASLNLYRIVQEMIQNIVKHARAKTVEFTLFCDNRITLQIMDDGIGFDTGQPMRKSGLENMEYRANEINYHIQINSEPGKGTTIRLEEKN